MHAGEQKDTLLFPEGPTGQFRDYIADEEEFQSLSSHGISHSLDNLSMEESSRKKNRTLSCFYIVFHYHHPNLRTKSWFFTILFQEVTLIALSNDACLVSQKMPQKKLMILGGEETE